MVRKSYHYFLFSLLGGGPIPFIKRDWKKIDEDFQDLIRLCLEFKPEKRINAEHALEHSALN